MAVQLGGLSRLLLKAETFLLKTGFWMSPIQVLSKLRLHCTPVILPFAGTSLKV